MLCVMVGQMVYLVMQWWIWLLLVVWLLDRLFFSVLWWVFIMCVVCQVCSIILLIWFIVWELLLIIEIVFILCNIFFVVMVDGWIWFLVNVRFFGIWGLRWWYIISMLRCLLRVFIVCGWVGLVELGSIFGCVVMVMMFGVCLLLVFLVWQV